MIPATEENIERARDFIWEKWKERAREMGRDEPEDLASACKFASLFAEMVFGGSLRGNWSHQFTELDKRIIDLTAGRSKYADPKYYFHDRKFWKNPEHRESMVSCEPRVKKWAEEFISLHEEIKDIQRRAGI